MNRESHDRLDEMIDASARELVAHEPTQQLYAAALAEVREARTPRRHRILMGWGFAAASAALVMAIVVWNNSRNAIPPNGMDPNSVRSGSSVQLPELTAREVVSIAEPPAQRPSRQSSLPVATTSDTVPPVDAIQIEVIESEPVQIEPIGLTEIQVAAISVGSLDLDMDSSTIDARP